MFPDLRRLLATDIAIDLGTATTLIYVEGKGVVLTEPSVVAVETTPQGAKSVFAVGRDAKRLLGRAPGTISAVRPIRDGVIADFRVACAMLSHLIGRTRGDAGLFRPRAIVTVPYGITEVERRAVLESVTLAGARKVTLLEEPMAAAIGAGLDVSQPVGRMIVDIGGGTTDVAVVSSYGIVHADSMRLGGDLMDQAVMQAVKKTHGLLIGETTAERIKMEIGGASPGAEVRSLVVRGRDLFDQVPRTLELKSIEVSEALREAVETILDRVMVALERVPPEISADLVDGGITLVGGGSLLPRLGDLVHQRTGLPIRTVENPQECVVLGAGACLEDAGLLARVSIPV